MSRENPPVRAQVVAEQEAARRNAAVAMSARLFRPGFVAAVETWVFGGGWADCGKCGQSCTSVYVGVITCIRCTSSRRILG